MLQVGGEGDLALESCGAHLARQLRRQDLDDHLPIERPLRGEEEAAHPAGGQLSLDAVGITKYRLDALQQLRHRGRRVSACRWTAGLVRRVLL